MSINYSKISFLVVNEKAYAGIYNKAENTFVLLVNNKTMQLDENSLVFQPHFAKRQDRTVFCWRANDVENSFFGIEKLGSYNIEMSYNSIDTKSKSTIKDLQNYFLKNFNKKVSVARDKDQQINSYKIDL